ncbi:MAG: hypothetical protein OEW97_05475, partial [Gammaproteobacteria bacterium]|nr:hypothetical protein [Gammaproteobacteria bacterium]
FTNVPAEYVDEYLEKIDNEHYRVNDSLRKRICFNRLNLLDINKSSVGEMEIIICQNVLIYFKRETRIAILNQLVEHLVPGGLLILGAGEITSWQHPELTARRFDGVLAFQRETSQQDKTQRNHAATKRYDA